MGKVYDALRRAEREKNRSDDSAFSTDSGVATSHAVDDRLVPLDIKMPFWRRWFGRQTIASMDTEVGDTNKQRISLLEPNSFVSEQFRTLRARLDALALQRPIRTIAFTSALSGEGKSTASVNFAIVSAMNVEKRVLLVDCDFRKPTVAKALGIRPTSGLGEILTGKSTIQEAIVRVEGVQLDVIPVRAQPPNPSELLASERMKRLVEEVARMYDLVIFDVPATLPLPDSKTVSEYTDGLVMVVRADYTPQDDVGAALDILDRRRVLGILLNGVTQDRARYYGYYY